MAVINAPGGGNLTKTYRFLGQAHSPVVGQPGQGDNATQISPKVPAAHPADSVVRWPGRVVEGACRKSDAPPQVTEELLFRVLTSPWKPREQARDGQRGSRRRPAWDKGPANTSHSDKA